MSCTAGFVMLVCMMNSFHWDLLLEGRDGVARVGVNGRHLVALEFVGGLRVHFPERVIHIDEVAVLAELVL